MTDHAAACVLMVWMFVGVCSVIVAVVMVPLVHAAGSYLDALADGRRAENNRKRDADAERPAAPAEAGGHRLGFAPPADHD